jgi:hypothetical protein
VALAAAGFLFLAGCAPPATVIADPVFAELFLSGSEPEDRLADAARSAGHRLRTVTLDALPVDGEALAAALEDAAARGPVAVSPLLAAPARAAAVDLEPAAPVLLLAGTGNAGTPSAAAGDGGSGGGAAAGGGGGGAAAEGAAAGEPGVSVVRHDRRAAFEELGARVADHLVAEGDGEGARRAVFYVLRDTEARRREQAALRRGLGAAEDAARFVEIEEAGDSAAVREELFRVRSPETAAVGAFLGPRNELVLDELAGAERTPPLVATEDLGPAAAYAELVGFSVERDYAAALEAFLAGSRGEITVPARLVLRESR